MLEDQWVRGKPLVFGIVNLTPDSFSDGAPLATVSDFLNKAQKLIDEGADVLDIGAESTRPGAPVVSEEEEWRRLMPFLQLFRECHPNFPLSLDSRKVEIIRKAAPYALAVVNDVSFAQDEKLIFETIRQGAYYILMHSRGTPQTMLSLTDYGDDLVLSVQKEMSEKILKLKQMGMDERKIILDPGFGFAKSPEQCRELMQKINLWKPWRDQLVPKSSLMIGISRKRFLQLYTGENLPEERDAISATLAREACLNGFQMIRTHDAALTKKALSM